MIRLSDILDSPKRVQHDLDGKEFIASAVGYGGVVAIAAWEIGDKPIRRGRHKMYDAMTRENWFLHLSLVKEAA
jgi:hypothetical protein